MKILLVNKFYWLNGGSERVLFQERDYFKKRGLDVVDFSMQNAKNVDTPQASRFIPWVDYRNGDGPFRKALNALKFIHNPQAVNRLADLVDEEKPDIAHLHNIYHQITPSIIPMLKKKGMKIVMSLHDYKLVCPNYLMLAGEAMCDDCKGRRFHSPLARNCQGSRAQELLLAAEAFFHKWNKSYDHVDTFIAPSQFMADMIAEHRIPRERIAVIRNGIEKDRFVPTWEDDGYAVYLGRLSKEKGVETLCRAHAMLDDPMPLKIIGSGPLHEELEARYPSVEFLGYRSGDELMRLLQRASFVSMPSEWYENCPMSALESMALGKPMLGANIGGIPELIDDGRTGLLFEMGNAGDLAQKFEALASDPDLRDMMGRNAKAKQQEHHDVCRRNDAVFKIYESLLQAA